MMRLRSGMALVAMIAVLSLIAILTIATLSVTTRLQQGGALAVRDARLEAAASFALSTALVEWRSHAFASLTVGATGQLLIPVPNSPIVASITVTRLTSELFWVVADAATVDGSRRSENIVLRLAMPRPESLSALMVGGAASLSSEVTVVRDTEPGCAPSVPDLLIGPHASFTSPDGSLPSMTMARSSATTDSAYQRSLESFDTAALAASADVTFPPGASVATPSGIAHATGDLTLTVGAGTGVLIVDGRLTIGGPISYAGVIVAKGGFVTNAAGARVTGSIRTGSAGGGPSGDLTISEPFEIRPSACVVQTILSGALMPHRVSGRAWAEIY